MAVQITCNNNLIFNVDSTHGAAVMTRVSRVGTFLEYNCYLLPSQTAVEKLKKLKPANAGLSCHFLVGNAYPVRQSMSLISN